MTCVARNKIKVIPLIYRLFFLYIEPCASSVGAYHAPFSNDRQSKPLRHYVVGLLLSSQHDFFSPFRLFKHSLTIRNADLTSFASRAFSSRLDSSCLSTAFYSSMGQMFDRICLTCALQFRLRNRVLQSHGQDIASGSRSLFPEQLVSWVAQWSDMKLNRAS